MNITEITVSAHEKRNHPYEYGHYDAEVSYTATVGVADDILRVTKELQYLADSFVREKCDQWISLVNLERKVAAFEATFRSRLNNAVWANDEAELERHLADLDKWLLENSDGMSVTVVSDMRVQIDPARAEWQARKQGEDRTDPEPAIPF